LYYVASLSLWSLSADHIKELRKFQAERAGIAVNLHSKMSVDAAVKMYDRMGESTRLDVDNRMKSPLLGNNIQYIKPTYQRQAFERAMHKRQANRFLLHTLRSLLFLRNRGGVKI
jgi:hypothetical protein